MYTMPPHSMLRISLSALLQTESFHPNIFTLMYAGPDTFLSSSLPPSMGTLLKSDDAIVSSHLEWCRQRILSVKPEEPLTAGMPLQEVSVTAYHKPCNIDLCHNLPCNV